MTDKKRKYLDWLLLMIVNFMWATQAPVIKLIGDRLGPVAIAFLPMIVSTLLFVPVLWWQNHKSGRPLKIERGDLKHFVAAGLFGFFLLQLTYTLGAQRTLASNAAINTLSIPVLVAIAASFMLKEKLNIVRVLGFVLGLAGVLLTSISDIRSADLGRSSYYWETRFFLWPAQVRPFTILIASFWSTSITRSSKFWCTRRLLLVRLAFLSLCLWSPCLPPHCGVWIGGHWRAFWNWP